MKIAQPYEVNGKVNLLVMNADDGLPAAFALMGTLAESKVAMRITGGCKGMSVDDKAQMLQFFADAFSGYKGLVWSGGTRMVVDGHVDPMVTDVPGVIASVNNGCVALGTVPRTDMLTLQGDSRLVLDQWGTVPNPDLLGILIVQNGPDGAMDWDGDLDAYFALMQNWRTYAGFTSLGLCSWNGGDITRAEIMRAIKRDWPVFLVRGSGRVTDEIITQWENKDASLMKNIPEKFDNLYIVDKNDAMSLHHALERESFFR